MPKPWEKSPFCNIRTATSWLKVAERLKTKDKPLVLLPELTKSEGCQPALSYMAPPVLIRFAHSGGLGVISLVVNEALLMQRAELETTRNNTPAHEGRHDRTVRQDTMRGHALKESQLMSL